MSICSTPAQGRRKLFWATQPEGCSSDAVCGFECGTPGLIAEPLTGTGHDGTVQDSVTFSTDDWLRGLMINMLMTNGRQADDECGFKPGSQGGHWSESYMENQVGVGTLLRTVQTTTRVQESVSLLTAYTKVTLERLVSRGVAVRVEAVGKYLGSGRFQLEVEVFGPSGSMSRVGLSALRLTNGWMWTA